MTNQRTATQPLVSICIPSLGRDTVERAIRSVLDQRYPNFEVVVSDNGVTLGSLVERLADPRVRYVRNRTVGMANNFTFALDHGRGDLLGLLPDDDRLLPEFLDRTVACFSADPTLAFVFTNHYFDHSGQRQIRSCALPGGTYRSFLPQFLRYLPVPISATLMRRDAWHRLRPLPDLYTADHALYVRAALDGYAFHYLDEPLMVYGIHAGQLSASDARFREDNVKLWEMFDFDDPECERLRRSYLARSLISLAASHLKRGRFADARHAAMQARDLRVPTLSRRERAVLMAAVHGSLARVSVRMWSWRHH